MENELDLEQKKARRAEINRANAQKSTGPKTPAGKASSRHNRLKHGRRSKLLDISGFYNPVLLPGESLAAYTRTVEGLLTKLAPRDHAERDVIYRLAACQWELNRYRAMRLFLLEDKFQTVDVKMNQGGTPVCSESLYLVRAFQVASAPGGGLAQLRLEIAAVERSIAACYRELKQMRSLDPIDSPTMPFNEATDIARKIYSSVEPAPTPEPEPEPDEIPPAAPGNEPQTTENNAEELTEPPQNHDERSQNEPTAFGYSYALPARRPPVFEPGGAAKPKVRTAGGAA